MAPDPEPDPDSDAELEPWPDDDEPEYDPDPGGAGTYRLTVLSEGDVTLADPIPDIRTGHVVLGGAPEPYAPGQLLMLGGPDWSSFEIVQVKQPDPATGRWPTCPVRRAALHTVPGPHRAGTPVTPIAVEPG